MALAAGGHQSALNIRVSNAAVNRAAARVLLPRASSTTPSVDLLR
jgi:hypothetical protein